MQKATVFITGLATFVFLMPAVQGSWQIAQSGGYRYSNGNDLDAAGSELYGALSVDCLPSCPSRHPPITVDNAGNCIVQDVSGLDMNCDPWPLGCQWMANAGSINYRRFATAAAWIGLEVGAATGGAAYFMQAGWTTRKSYDLAGVADCSHWSPFMCFANTNAFRCEEMAELVPQKETVGGQSTPGIGWGLGGWFSMQTSDTWRTQIEQVTGDFACARRAVFVDDQDRILFAFQKKDMGCPVTKVSAAWELAGTPESPFMDGFITLSNWNMHATLYQVTLGSADQIDSLTPFVSQYVEKTAAGESWQDFPPCPNHGARVNAGDVIFAGAGESNLC